jgi:EmrB/QacA subfamily drug resistance transporter
MTETAFEARTHPRADRSGPSEDPESSDRKYRMRWWILAVLSASLLIIIVDDPIVNVALPTLQRELGASAAALQWIVNSYILVFGGLLLTMGTLGDRFGRRRFLQLGFLLFGAASLYGAFAGSTTELIVARTAMGIGGAMIMPSTLSVIIDVFPRNERVQAIGIWAGVAHLGIPLGPVLGGWLLERYWWGSVFLVNVPIVAAVLVAGWLLVPESRHPSPPRPDVRGMLLSTASLASFLYAIIEAPEVGWLSGKVIGGFGLAVIAGIGFIGHERHVPEPMLDLRLFGNARLKWGTIAITLAMFALAGLTFDLTQFLQIVKGYSPLQAGLRILPLVIGFGLAGHIGQHLVRRVGTRWAVGGGLGAIAALLLAFAQVEPTTAYWLLGSGLFLIGIAMGTVFIPSTDSVMAAVPRANAGLGSALNDTSRQVGAALGIGVLGSLTNTTYSAQIEDSLSGLAPNVAALAKRSVGAALQVADAVGGEAGGMLHRAAIAAFTDGFTLAMLAGAGLLSAGAVIVWRRLPRGDASPPPHGPPADGDPALKHVAQRDNGRRQSNVM